MAAGFRNVKLNKAARGPCTYSGTEQLSLTAYRELSNCDLVYMSYCVQAEYLHNIQLKIITERVSLSLVLALLDRHSRFQFAFT